MSRNRKPLTLGEKLRVIEEAEKRTGSTKASIARDLNIPESSLKTILAKKDSILLNASKFGLNRKAAKDGKYAAMEKALRVSGVSQLLLRVGLVRLVLCVLALLCVPWRAEMAPTPPVAAPSEVKKRGQHGSYKTLTMAKKAEIIRQVEGGRPQSEVAREFSISKQTVSDYLKQKAKILEAAEKASAGVSSVCYYNGAQVADPVSAQPPSTSSRNRSCSPTKSANPLLFRNLPGICAGLSGGRLPLLGRVDAVSQQGHQNATVPGSSVPLEEQLQNVSLKEHSGTATCVRVTNFDPSLDMKVVKRMLVAVFQEKGLTVLNVTVNLQQDGNVEAFVYVPSAPEAVRAFHLIHQRRVGLYCLHLSVDEEVQAGMGVPPRCLLHDSTRPVATVAGTARPLARPLPEACVPRATWVAQLRRLLDAHDGILLLDSLKACYRAEFGALPIETNLEKWQAGTVPLEHLVASVPGVSVVSSKRGFKRAQREESSNKTESIVKGSPTERLALDMVELLSLQPHCRVEVGRLTTVYQAHFSRNFCVLNYGCAKVADVMATIPEVVEVLGHGYHGVITLTHAEQMKRFVWDMERLFEGLIAPKTLSMASLLQLYLTTFERPLEVADYGVCTLDDLLEALPQETFVVERKEGTVFITYPESPPPDPTLEVAERLRLFARELVQLLGPLGDKGLPVHKLGSAYQQEFGRPLRIANYLPYGKMTHLIEAISDVAEIHKSGRRKMVRLVPGYRHPSRQLPPVP
ncbi:hypothetical protein MRX96_021779 [Rhipicephalus microplus]